MLGSFLLGLMGGRHPTPPSGPAAQTSPTTAQPIPSAQPAQATAPAAPASAPAPVAAVPTPVDSPATLQDFTASPPAPVAAVPTPVEAPATLQVFTAPAGPLVEETPAAAAEAPVEGPVTLAATEPEDPWRPVPVTAGAGGITATASPAEEAARVESAPAARGGPDESAEDLARRYALAAQHFLVSGYIAETIARPGATSTAPGA